MNPEGRWITRRRKTTPHPYSAKSGRCTVARKPRFTTWGDAAAAAVYLSRGRALSADYCPACGGWHLTRRPRKDTP